MMNSAYIQRAIAPRLKRLFEHFSCIVLLGARQVGKSTLLKETFETAKMVTFDPIVDVQGARTDPDLFLQHQGTPLILDEIQYAPELISSLKRRIDEHKQLGLYLVTGSQQWGVLQNISESLAGRAILLNLEGFSLAELAGHAFEKPWLERWLESPEQFIATHSQRLMLPRDLYSQLWRGFLPEAHFLEEDLITDFQASYQRTYIERDVRLMADVSDLALFGRFVRLAAAMTAQEINYSEFGRDIGITPQTAKRWLNTLTQAFEWFEIPAFSMNAIKKISGKPKGYFSDTGQICFSQMISGPTALSAHPLWGAIFESAVVNELRKQSLVMSTPPYFYHWRSYSGAECDLILERDGRFYPIEIKANSHPSKKDARGITRFRETYPQLNIQKGLILAPASNVYPVTEQDYVVPWDVCL